MCNHMFEFPEDKPENYNLDGKTLTGQCRCGAIQKAYGMKWIIPITEKFSAQFPYEEWLVSFIVKEEK